MKHKVLSPILKFSDDIIVQELNKYKNINNRNIMNKGKLVDYAIIKTYNPQCLDVLKQDCDYKKFIAIMEKQQ